MDPLDMIRWHSMARPGAATVGRNPEMRRLASLSIAVSIGLHVGALLAMVLWAEYRKDRFTAAETPLEVAIVSDGPTFEPQIGSTESPSQVPLPTNQREIPMPAVPPTRAPIGKAESQPADSLARSAGAEAPRQADMPSAPSTQAMPSQEPPKPLPAAPTPPQIAQITPQNAPPTPAKVDPKPAPEPPAQVPTTVTGGPLQSGDTKSGKSAQEAQVSTARPTAGENDIASLAAGPVVDRPGMSQAGGDGALLVSVGILKRDRPPYPIEARRRGEQGEVLLRVGVAANGRIVSITVVQSSGSAALDAAARRGVSSWTFSPARRANGPVASSVDIPIQFKLDN